MSYSWIGVAAVIAVHDELLAERGGQSGVRSMELLEGAVFRPINVVNYRDDVDIALLAAAYVHGLRRNHPFIDGNKRTAWSTATAFLDLNGYDIHAEMTEAYAAMMALATSEIGEEEFTAWLRDRLRPSQAQGEA